MIDPSLRVLTDAGVIAAAASLGCEPAIVRAVAEVESRGSGFLPDGRPVILFEGHVFSRRTGGEHDLQHPTVSYPKWTRAHYVGGEREYDRLAEAQALDPNVALESASWGAFQIMGFNARSCGFRGVFDFVAAMHESADRHLLAFVEFVKSQGLDDALRRMDWTAFARGYNGSGFAQNRYDVKLAAAYAKHAASA